MRRRQAGAAGGVAGVRGSKGAARRLLVRASSVEADAVGTWALLGTLLSLAGVGAANALSTAVDERREKELLARAKARHEAYIQSGAADEEEEEEEEMGAQAHTQLDKERQHGDREDREAGRATVPAVFSAVAADASPAGAAKTDPIDEEPGTVNSVGGASTWSKALPGDVSSAAVDETVPATPGESTANPARECDYLAADSGAAMVSVDPDQPTSETRSTPSKEQSIPEMDRPLQSGPEGAAPAQLVVDVMRNGAAAPQAAGDDTALDAPTAPADALEYPADALEPEAADEAAPDEASSEAQLDAGALDLGAPGEEADEVVSETGANPVEMASEATPSALQHPQPTTGGRDGSASMPFPTETPDGDQAAPLLDAQDGPESKADVEASQQPTSLSDSISEPPAETPAGDQAATTIDKQSVSESKAEGAASQQASAPSDDISQPSTAESLAESQAAAMLGEQEVPESKAEGAASQQASAPSDDISQPSTAESLAESQAAAMLGEQEVPESKAEGAASQPSAPSDSSRHNVQLFYRTGWKRPAVHGSVAGSDWADYAADQEAQGHWHVFSWNAKEGQGAPLLEFVIADESKSSWDKPAHGGNYVISEPGKYTLRHGVLSKIPDGPQFMVVSDLDGTMVGNDAFTSAFKEYWDSGPRLTGCKLVYSTGRSLELYRKLAEEKAGVLAEPDILILGVGTEVQRSRGGGAFEKDPTWEALLNNGWDVQKVYDAVRSSIAELGADHMHLRDPSEQNDHKVTCGVKVDMLQQAVAGIEAKLSESQVTANIISSGAGEWRYLDIVSRQAGKRESLEFVARAEGFPLERTVACGDSGNDILMLAGESKAIVVGNAQEDLRRWVEDNPGAVAPAGDTGRARLYCAGEPEATGILEGLSYFQFRA